MRQRKLTSLLLVIAMVMSLIPFAMMSVSAAAPASITPAVAAADGAISGASVQGGGTIYYALRATDIGTEDDAWDATTTTLQVAASDLGVTFSTVAPNLTKADNGKFLVVIEVNANLVTHVGSVEIDIDTNDVNAIDLTGTDVATVTANAKYTAIITSGTSGTEGKVDITIVATKDNTANATIEVLANGNNSKVAIVDPYGLLSEDDTKISAADTLTITAADDLPAGGTAWVFLTVTQSGAESMTVLITVTVTANQGAADMKAVQDTLSLVVLEDDPDFSTSSNLIAAIATELEKQFPGATVDTGAGTVITNGVTITVDSGVTLEDITADKTFNVVLSKASGVAATGNIAVPVTIAPEAMGDPTGALLDAKNFITAANDDPADNMDQTVLALPYADLTDTDTLTDVLSELGDSIQSQLLGNDDLWNQVLVKDVTYSARKEQFTLTLKTIDGSQTSAFVIDVTFAEMTDADKVAADLKAIENFDWANPKNMISWDILSTEEREEFLVGFVKDIIKNGEGSDVAVSDKLARDAFQITLTNGNASLNTVVLINLQITVAKVEVFFADDHGVTAEKGQPVERPLVIGDKLAAEIVLSDGTRITGLDTAGVAATPSGVTFAWDAAGSTKDTALYTVVAGDIGNKLKVSGKVDITATGANKVSKTGTKTWKADTPVAKITKIEIIDADTGETLTDAPYVGQNLKAVITTSAADGGVPTVAAKVLWKSGDSAISSGLGNDTLDNGVVITDATYTVVLADVGKNLKVTIDDSASTEFVAADAANVKDETGTVVNYDRIEIVKAGTEEQVSDILIEGTELEVRVFLPNDEQLFSNIAYQWIQGTTDISGATSESYEIDDSFIGETISVKVTVNSESDPVTKVVGVATKSGDIPALDSGVISVSGETTRVGSPVVGDVLEVNLTFTEDINSEARKTAAEPSEPILSINSVNGFGTAPDNELLSVINSEVNITYKWYSVENGAINPLGTGASYTVTEADQGSLIKVDVSVGGSVKGTLPLSAKAAVVSTEGANSVGINSTTALEVSDTTNKGAKINLTTEMLSVPSDYTVASYSIDGGVKWKKGAVKLDKNGTIGGLLNKDLTLWLSDKEVGKNGVPAEATLIKFPAVKKRAALPKFTVNYLEGAQKSSWLLVGADKKNTDSFGNVIKEGLEIALVNSDKTVGDYGVFYGTNATVNGIRVESLPSTGKPSKTAYMVRLAAVNNGDGTYTASSKAKKISVAGEQKMPNFKVKNDKISVKANTYVEVNGTITLYTAKASVDAVSGMKLWTGATAKKPASAQQIMP